MVDVQRSVETYKDICLVMMGLQQYVMASFKNRRVLYGRPRT